jgi:hypothetical protein
MKISCSSRAKDSWVPIQEHLDLHINTAEKYSNFKFSYDNIDSIYGQVGEYIPLYGGRPAVRPEISWRDITWIYDKGIGLKLTLQNKFITDKAYKESKPVLKKYNKKGNSIIVAIDKFAEYIKNDFPNYNIEASCIQDITNNEKLEQKVSLGLYDTIVLPIHCNDDIKFIESIKRKDLIRLFMNIECSYNCPSKVCYGITSKLNTEKTFEENSKRKFTCSLVDFGMERTFYKDDITWWKFYFDLPMYEKMGITKFKLVTPKEGQQRTALMYKKNRSWLIKKKK